MSVEKGNSSSISASPVLASAVIRCRPMMLARYASCSIRISFSISCGVAPAQLVLTVIVRTARSGIICTGMRIAASTPNRQISSTVIVISVPRRISASNMG